MASFPISGPVSSGLQRAARLGMRTASMEGSAGTQSAFQRASSTTPRSRRRRQLCRFPIPYAQNRSRNRPYDAPLAGQKIWKKIQKNLKKIQAGDAMRLAVSRHQDTRPVCGAMAPGWDARGGRIGNPGHKRARGDVREDGGPIYDPFAGATLITRWGERGRSLA
jgi:hypothetical protein